MFLVITGFSQTTYDFSTPAVISSQGGWNSVATINIGGVSYTISGGIDGGYTNLVSGGKGNSRALYKDGSGGDNFNIKRTDGKRFQFFGLWLKQSSMCPYQVQLKWETSDEINTAYFIVEESADGRNFTSIGKVLAAVDTLPVIKHIRLHVSSRFPAPVSTGLK